MLIYQCFDREDASMGEKIDLLGRVTQLVEIAYPELNPNNVTSSWGRTNSFATISWTQDFKDIRLRCSNEIKHWHDAALTGLLSHELSHPAQMKNNQSENSTDLDAIERGFGPYLGVERLFAGKYEDHIIRKGKDRYLGYRSIRKLLSWSELKHLDVLLSQLRLFPGTKNEQQNVYHDILIMHSTNNTTIQIDGQEFEIELKEDPEVTLLQKGKSIRIIVDGEDIGRLEDASL